VGRDAGGAFRALNPPFRLSAAPAAVQPWAPALGEHGDAILGEAGYSTREIEEFRTKGVLG
jgi:crotonobetainyl-CoA:carnitine CoA-transferase CaiB-like acyl-CoA transferase